MSNAHQPISRYQLTAIDNQLINNVWEVYSELERQRSIDLNFFSHFPLDLFRFNKNASSIMEIMDGFAAKIN